MRLRSAGKYGIVAWTAKGGGQHGTTRFLYQLVEIDDDKARNYWEQAAEKGDVRAPYNLGWLYEHGEGVDINYETALDYYRQAFNMGNRNAAAKAEEMRAKLNG